MSTQSIILAGRQAGRQAGMQADRQTDRQDSSVFLCCPSSIYIRRALPMGFVGGARLLICFYSYIC